MKKFLFILCCLGCVLATLYLAYTCWLASERNDNIWRVAMRVAGTLGWIVITYRVVTKKDRWIQKTFR